MLRSRFRTVTVAGACVLGVGIVVVGFAAPALAHVTVNAVGATQGGYTKITFRVPNEKDSASTTKLEVNLPTDTPIASVSLKPLAGWTATIQKAKLATPITSDDGQITEAVDKITWAADANSAIKPGQFQEFDVSLGPLPKTDQIVFKALQTYSDGAVVRWIDVPAAGEAEPEHPAPTLKLAAVGGDGTDSGAPADPALVAAPGSRDTRDSTALWLGLLGAVLGLAGMVTGVLAYRRASAESRSAA
jgi:uncharacterized protein YcnI